MGKLVEKIRVRKREKMLRLLKNAEEFTKEHPYTRNVGLKLPRTAVTICKSLSKDLRSEGNRERKRHFGCLLVSISRLINILGCMWSK